MATLRRKLKSLLYVTVYGIGAYGAIAYVKNDPKFYRNVLMPLVHVLDPEDAHNFAVFTAQKHYLIPQSRFQDPDSLHVNLFGKLLKNPVGIAAGFDKNGEAILGLSKIGFGFIEIGSVTPVAQEGNPKPRVFRLKEDKAIINRYGFNNDGHDVVYQRVLQIKQNHPNIVVGVNLGKNKTSLDPVQDYVAGVEKFKNVADYLVINVSSPNTPGLRNMQQKNALKQLLVDVMEARKGDQPAIVLKLAPDLSYEEMQEICQVISQKASRVDGLIISNTTVERPRSLSNLQGRETGGLSGKPLKDFSTNQIRQIYQLTAGKIPIIGVGGIFNGGDAFEKIQAGATVVQLYTSLVYEGPPVVTTVKKELSEILASHHYSNICEAVGISA